jgi:formamidopyrimidine-DNA glycosylase
MPELPDVTVYVETLRRRLVAGAATRGATLEKVWIRSPFVLRTFDPAPEAGEGLGVVGVERLGKRILLAMEGELFYVIHLMIAGRFQWKDAAKMAGSKSSVAGPPKGKIDLAAFDFDAGRLLLTEASQKKRASIHVVRGRDALKEHNPGGLDVMTCSPADFAAALRRENRTLKRALASPRTFDGIGNAYSDEILHEARLGPLKLTRSLSDEEAERLREACRSTLATWTAKLFAEFGMDGGKTGRFPGPGQITAFRPDFAVHGKFGQPCPACGTPVQRIVYADNETNYCPTCQTGGKVLADRSMSRLLGDDWPRTVEEWENG